MQTRRGTTGSTLCASSTRPQRRRAGRALTLLEVLVSVSLIVLLLSAMLSFFWQSIAIREEAARNANRTQIARQVLDHLASELRGCIGVDQVGFPVEYRLIGDRRSITFLTTVLPEKFQYEFYRESDDLPPAQHDLQEVSYSLWIDPDETTEEGEPIVGGIIRTVKKTLNQFIVDEEDPLDLRTDLWSPELGYLEFRYFDGVEWDVTWDITEGNSLPQLIQVTVGFDSITNYSLEDQDLEEFPIDQCPLGDELYHPDRYSVMVRIPAADRMFGSRIQRVGKQLSDQLGVEGGF
ncbi:MAG: type II secretion system GspH family protein [Planctomycetes bacterium]|nr:type II secretion system GspH family protein [Planctomycetota bacterium]